MIIVLRFPYSLLEETIRIFEYKHLETHFYTIIYFLSNTFFTLCTCMYMSQQLGTTKCKSHRRVPKIQYLVRFQVRLVQTDLIFSMAALRVKIFNTDSQNCINNNNEILLVTKIPYPLTHCKLLFPLQQSKVLIKLVVFSFVFVSCTLLSKAVHDRISNFMLCIVC